MLPLLPSELFASLLCPANSNSKYGANFTAMARTRTKQKHTKPLRRSDLPVALPGATSFSDNRDELSCLEVLRLLKQEKEIVAELIAATTVIHEGRRQRQPGSWALAFFAFANSKVVDIEPWWRDSIDTHVWELCDFEDGRRPDYSVVYERFCELELFEAEFRKAANKLIQRARKLSGGLVGRDVHVDGTESETNARLQHICPPGGCPRDSGSRGPAVLPQRVPTSVARASRQEAAKAPPPEDMDAPVLGEGRKIREMIDKSGRKYLLVTTKHGCLYRSYDVTAGARMYDGVKGATTYWHGFMNIKSVDHYTGAALDSMSRTLRSRNTTPTRSLLIGSSKRLATSHERSSTTLDQPWTRCSSTTRAKASPLSLPGDPAAIALAPGTTMTNLTAMEFLDVNTALAKAGSSRSRSARRRD